MFTIFDLVEHFANALEAIGSAFKDMLMFRTFLILGLSMELIYDFNISAKPLWTTIIWTSIIIFINLFQVMYILYERGRLSFTAAELKIFHQVFNKMSKVEFKKLIRSCEWSHVGANSVLVEEETVIDRLILIYEGMAEVKVKDKIVAILRDGQFIGEMSFLTGNLTTATVISMTELKFISWKVDRLSDLIKKPPAIGNSLTNIFNADLIQKITIRNTE
jgi:hypothetical protein